jgi:hypothetical protein
MLKGSSGSPGFCWGKNLTHRVKPLPVLQSAGAGSGAIRKLESGMRFPGVAHLAAAESNGLASHGGLR